MIDTVFYRKMTVADIDGVLKIEEEAFSLPWTRDAFVQEMTTNLHAYYIVAAPPPQLPSKRVIWGITPE